MNQTRILQICIGIGSCIVVMSLMKKLFNRKKTKKSTSNETVMSGTLSGVSNEGLLDSSSNQLDAIEEKAVDLKISTSSSSANSDSPINRSVRQTRRKLNSTLRKYRKKEKRLERKKNEIAQMEKEIQNLMQAIKHNELQMESLHEDFKDKQLEMLAITSYITPDSEAEIKKREILCYKRYNGIKTMTDAKNVFTMIRQRQRALKTLEILTFKKYWSFVHKADKKANSPFLLRNGIENWFRQFKPNTETNDSSQETHSNTCDDEKELTTEAGHINPTFVSLLEATV